MTASSHAATIVPMGSATDPAICGGKGAALGRLAADGFDVPAFFVLADGFFELPNSDGWLVSSACMLGAGPYAVRSSGVDEDGADNSHAGQFLSLLNVEARDVPEAACKVRASGISDGLSAYQAARGSAGGRLPSVVVQVMVPARVAGVAFSADPVTGRRDRVVVSAVKGLGDRLVGGEDDGETWTVEKTTGFVLAVPGGERVLSEADAREVAALAEAIEHSRGCPQDVEWAFEGSRLRVLQARPVTTWLRPLPVADRTVVVLDNSNIVESYPGVVTPLTFSFAQYAYARVYIAFVRLLGVPESRVASAHAVFENMLARVDGRVYYKLDNWYRALALLPGYRLNRGYMERMMGLDEAPPEGSVPGSPPARGFDALIEVGRILKGACVFGLAAFRLSGLKRGFGERFEAAVVEADPKTIPSMSATGLAALYRRIEASLLDRWDAPLVNDFLCMMAFGATRKLMERRLGADGAELHNAFLIGQGDVVSARPARMIEAMAALVRGDEPLRTTLEKGDPTELARRTDVGDLMRDYVETFGDRCTGELKLESSTLHDDPSPLYHAVAASAGRPAATVRLKSDAEAAIRARLAGAPLFRAFLMPLLGYAKRRVRDRENLRFERTRIFGRARLVFRAMGIQFHALGLLEDPKDVFMLTVRECLGAIEGGGVDFDIRALAAMRSRETALFPKEDRPARIVATGVVADRGPRTSSAVAPVATGLKASAVGCSAGVVEGVARVVVDPRERRIGSGEILVARSTDPGWIALFANAGAIVVERGSLLSHSAIVARELGIPCVVGLKDATRWIVDGERVRVDGAGGTVEKLS